MDNMMGLENVNLAFNAAGTGKLARWRQGDIWQLDSFALNVLLYMAAHTLDADKSIDNGYLPRCYTGGWESIAEGLGLLLTTATRDGVETGEKYQAEQRARRRRTAQSRISRACSELQKAGLLARVRDSSLGRKAVFVLTIGAAGENDALVRRASEKFS